MQMRWNWKLLLGREGPQGRTGQGGFFIPHQRLQEPRAETCKGLFCSLSGKRLSLAFTSSYELRHILCVPQKQKAEGEQLSLIQGTCSRTARRQCLP